MVNFKRKIKCISADCNNKVEQVNTFCEDCLERKTKKARLVIGNLTIKPDLQVNNPQGHNQHTPKDQLKPKEVILTDIEAFSRLSSEQQKEWLGKEGNALYRELREIRPRQIRFTKFRNLYEAKHFGWKTDND